MKTGGLLTLLCPHLQDGGPNSYEQADNTHSHPGSVDREYNARRDKLRIEVTSVAQSRSEILPTGSHENRGLQNLPQCS